MPELVAVRVIVTLTVIVIVLLTVPVAVVDGELETRALPIGVPALDVTDTVAE